MKNIVFLKTHKASRIYKLAFLALGLLTIGVSKIMYKEKYFVSCVPFYRRQTDVVNKGRL